MIAHRQSRLRRRQAQRPKAFGRSRDALLLLFGALLLLGALTGCVTGSGSLAGDVIRTEQQEDEDDADAAPSQPSDEDADDRSRGSMRAAGPADSEETDREEEDPDEEDRDGDGDSEQSDMLILSTSPRDAVIYLNGRYMGEAPLAVETLEPGRYDLRVEAEGYVTVTQTIRVDQETRLDIAIELQPITGRLRLTGEIDDAVISIDGAPAQSVAVDSEGYSYELPIGPYGVTVRRFGYEPYRAQVDIREMQTTVLEVDLSPRDFSISRIDTGRERFSPANAGALGRTAINFSVTTPGRGSFRVENQAGETLYREELGPFRGPDQRVTWDGSVNQPGTGIGSETAPDGSYFAVISGVGDGFDGADEQSVALRVDRSLVIRVRGGLSGVSGLAYAPLPDSLPQGSWQPSLSVLAHQTAVDAGVAARVPTLARLRIGLAEQTELGLFGGGVFVTDAEPRWFGGASLKRTLLSSPLMSAAVALRGTLQGGGLNTPDTLTNYPGLALSAPLRLGAEGFFAVTPELLLSPGRVSYDPGAAGGSAAWTGWGYLRLGAGYETPGWSLGGSAALRTAAFSERVGIDLPLQAAVEGQAVIPGTNLFVGGTLAAEASPRWLAGDGRFYLVGGGSIGLIF